MGSKEKGESTGQLKHLVLSPRSIMGQDGLSFLHLESPTATVKGRPLGCPSSN